MNRDLWRRAAWLRAGVSWDQLAEQSGWPPDGVEPQEALEEALDERGLKPWVPEGAPGVALLLVRGVVPPGPRVGVVGARATDAYGRSVAGRVARDATSLGCVVVSGGAEGCDAAAHEATLEAGGRTLVVLAGGHDHPFPQAHRGLFERVVDGGGGILSPCWPTVRPNRWRFLSRNRVIAALSHVTVVARARARSGSLSTARATRELGRPVLAVPGDVGQGLSEGCHALLEQGAGVARGPDSLARALGREDESASTGGVWPVGHGGSGDPWPQPHVSPDTDPMPQRHRVVADALAKAHVLDPAGLVGQTGLTVGAVMSSLMELGLRGWVEALGGDRYRWVGPAGGEGVWGTGSPS